MTFSKSNGEARGCGGASAVCAQEKRRSSDYSAKLCARGHHTTHVAERNLEPDPSEQPVEHPLLSRYFDKFTDGFYGNSREED